MTSNLADLITLVDYANKSTPHHFSFDYVGHVDSYCLRYYKNGFASGKEPIYINFLSKNTTENYTNSYNKIMEILGG